MKAGVQRVTLPDGQRVPVASALQAAMVHHQTGRVRRAAELYRRILEVAPGHADALHLLGLTERQQGNFTRAVELMQRAIAVNPRAAMFHSNLAEAWRAQGRVAEAEAASRQAIALDRTLPEAHLNLGAALLQRQAFDEALAAYTQALALRPGYLDALLGEGDALLSSGRHPEALARYERALERSPGNTGALTRIGITLRKQGRIDDAIHHYEQAIARCPGVPELHNNVALLYQRVGRLDAAAVHLRRLLELRPGDTSARHLLAAVEGTTTDRAPADYVRDVFDGYADTFESHLVQKLGYQMPERLGEAIRAVASSADAGWDVLDLGCGTGLMGEVLADRCVRLVGIDIAPKMVDKARSKGVYTELAVADILPFMRGCKAASFDLIVAADVFVYLGDLAAIFAEARRLLRPAGLFAFTVEAAEGNGDDFVLEPTGRYRHAEGYLHRLRTADGLDSARFTPAVIRYQQDQPVEGWLCVFSAPSTT